MIPSEPHHESVDQLPEGRVKVGSTVSERENLSYKGIGLPGWYRLAWGVLIGVWFYFQDAHFQWTWDLSIFKTSLFMACLLSLELVLLLETQWKKHWRAFLKVGILGAVIGASILFFPPDRPIIERIGMHSHGLVMSSGRLLGEVAFFAASGATILLFFGSALSVVLDRRITPKRKSFGT